MTNGTEKQHPIKISSTSYAGQPAEDQKKKNNIINFIVFTSVFLFGVFIAGPAIQSYVIDPMKPYIIVDREDYIKATTTQCKSCELPPVLPIEMTNKVSVNTMNIPLDHAPIKYKPYIHYPASWSEWWNPFQPNGIGPPLRIALNILVPLGAVAVLIYGIIVWRRGGFKEFIRRLKP